MGIKVDTPEDSMFRSHIEEEIEMLDDQGHIQYRKLNTAMLKKYKNPFRILYLWAV